MTNATVSNAFRAAVDRDDVAGALAIVGPVATGKTTALIARARRLASRRESTGHVAVFTPSDAGVRTLRERFSGDAHAADARVTCTPFGAFALDIVIAARAPNAPLPHAIDEADASMLFERAGASLFALEWAEFVADEIDPEITGLRSPERFSAAAFRLIRKLRGALVSPERFRTACLQGATKFYAHAPNLAHPDLLRETQAKYRDSLRVTSEELARQHQREIDLGKILTRLYEQYVTAVVACGSLTAIDAVYEATMLLRADPTRAIALRAAFPAALVDDAQDANAGQLGLLEAIYGATLANVTLVGDPAQSTRGFAAGGRGESAFAAATQTIALGDVPRLRPAIARVARIGAGDAAAARESAPADARDDVVVYRATSQRDETTFVASEVARLIAAGTPPERIAVVVRTLGCAHGFIDALLAREIPVDIGGAASLFAFPAVLDALAALWPVVDPFRHDFLLRALEAPWLALSDASIATLCGDAAEPQPLLFALDGDDVDEARAGRWDRRRDLRLGRNVTRGDVDLDLPSEARERLVAFRAARERWVATSRTHTPGDLARLILDETVVATRTATARGRFEGALVARLLDDIDAFAARDPLATLADYLERADRIARAEADLLQIALGTRDAVSVIDVEVAKGRDFDAVFVVDLHAGAWPRYYVPDAFLFSPGWGMLPKDNVGDAAAARTAKFTYVMFRNKIRETYNAEERRAFYVAATRAKHRLFLSASGRPTRGVSAPEILAEIERAT